MTLPEKQRRPGPGPRGFGSTWWVGAPFSPRDSVSSAVSLPCSWNFCRWFPMEDHAPEPAQVDTSMLPPEQVRRRSPLPHLGGGCLSREAWGPLQAEVRRDSQARGLGLPLLSSLQGLGEVGVSLVGTLWLAYEE